MSPFVCLLITDLAVFPICLAVKTRVRQLLGVIYLAFEFNLLLPVATSFNLNKLLGHVSLLWDWVRLSVTDIFGQLHIVIHALQHPFLPGQYPESTFAKTSINQEFSDVVWGMGEGGWEAEVSSYK
jgi:hypothetical protein